MGSSARTASAFSPSQSALGQNAFCASSYLEAVSILRMWDRVVRMAAKPPNRARAFATSLREFSAVKESCSGPVSPLLSTCRFASSSADWVLGGQRISAQLWRQRWGLGRVRRPSSGRTASCCGRSSSSICFFNAGLVPVRRKMSTPFRARIFSRASSARESSIFRVARPHEPKMSTGAGCGDGPKLW